MRLVDWSKKRSATDVLLSELNVSSMAVYSGMFWTGWLVRFVLPAPYAESSETDGVVRAQESDQAIGPICRHGHAPVQHAELNAGERRDEAVARAGVGTGRAPLDAGDSGHRPLARVRLQARIRVQQLMHRDAIDARPRVNPGPVAGSSANPRRDSERCALLGSAAFVVFRSGRRDSNPDVHLGKVGLLVRPTIAPVPAATRRASVVARPPSVHRRERELTLC